jgi:VWFA-related protein
MLPAAMILAVVLGMMLFSQDTETPLKYNVSVEAVTFPVFAVDAHGKPVYDLKKEDIEFTINGRAVDYQFISFQPHPSNTGEKEATKPALNKERITPVKPANRVICLSLDSMFNTPSGFERSKKFLKETITTSFPGETFVVLENAPKGGLKHITGPHKDQTKLLEAVDRLKWYPDKFRKFFFIKPRHKLFPLFLTNYFDVSHGQNVGASYKWTGNDAEWMISVDKWIENAKRRIYGSMFRAKLKRFGKALSQFKYVLQTINYPKIVFLISEGVAEETIFARKKSNLKGMSMEDIGRKYSFFYLRQVIRTINAGGSVLYTINPKSGRYLKNDKPGTLNLDELSLEYLAERSGGKYFKGPDVKKVAEEIKQTTAAYYQLAVTGEAKTAGREMINIKCKREGITLFYPRHNERKKPYHRMAPVQKKVFAHNLVFGGNWSRMVGKVRKVTYESMENRRGIKKIAVMIPEKMKNRKADIFLLGIDAKTGEADIKMKSKVLGVREVLNIAAQKNKQYYFAIIDPMTTLCIYSDRNTNGKG